jgi:hypothetical protein
MSLKFHKQIRFAAPVAEVYAMLGDPAFREKVASEAGADSYDVTITPNGPDGFASVVETQQSSAELPGVARKFLGDHYTIRQEETWAEPDEGALDVTIPGTPGMVGGVVALEADGDGTLQTVDADIKVGIPLIGGKVEKLIGQVLGNLLKLQERVGNDWLAGRR